MKRISRVMAVIVPVALVLVVAVMASSWLSAPVRAQTDGETQERTVSVSGQGRVSARPDTAIVRLGVRNEAETAVDALNQNSANMQGVISATLETGVEEADIQTQGIRLQPVYDPGEEGEQPTLRGYQASNIVELTVRDLDSLGVLLDAAIEAGGNTIENIRFEVNDTDELLVAAREAAMNDARAKAEQLVSLADAELGEVLTISESSSAPPQPVAFDRAEAVTQAAVPVQAGTEFVEAQVQVTWRIR